MDLEQTTDAPETKPPANPHADDAALAALEAEASAAALPEAAPAKESETAEVLALVMAPAFDVIAPNWNISKSEVKTLSEAYGAVIDKYFPDALNGFGVELTAVIMTLAIVAPRMHKPRKLEPKPQAVEADAHA